MKLFQKLLLTPAVIGFLSPITANASEANLMDVSSYSQVDVEVTQDTFKPLSSKNPLLAGGEGLNQNLSNDFDGDTFSSTTTAAFTTNFVAGAVSESTSHETTNLVYDYGIELTTSFSGDDALVVEMEAGNNTPVTDLDLVNNSNILSIASISYTKQLGDRLTLFVGSGGTSGSLLYTSACAYGGQTDVLDDCGIRSTNLDEELGTSFGASFDIGSGFSAAVGVEGQGDGTKGIFTSQATDAFGGQLAYTGDNFGVAVAFASIENHDGNNNIVAPTAILNNDSSVTTSSALSAYYTPDLENFPSISIGFESSHDNSKAASEDSTSNYFLGVQWDDILDGSLGASVGSKSATLENADAEKMYEVFYSYNYADGITITPMMFVKENKSSLVDDETGIFVKTSFSF